MFNIKTSDKVPSGYIFCIKEGALGNSHSTLTRKLSSAAPDCYRRPGKACQGGTGGGQATEPSRQMVVIRLDATKCIFWNFRSPQKTCWSSQRYRPPEVE